MEYRFRRRIFLDTWRTAFGVGYILVHEVQGMEKDISWYMKYSDKDISWYMEYRVRIGIYFGT